MHLPSCWITNILIAFIWQPIFFLHKQIWVGAIRVKCKCWFGSNTPIGRLRNPWICGLSIPCTILKMKNQIIKSHVYKISRICCIFMLTDDYYKEGYFSANYIAHICYQLVIEQTQLCWTHLTMEKPVKNLANNSMTFWQDTHKHLIWSRISNMFILSLI